MYIVRPVLLEDALSIQNVARASWKDTYKEIYTEAYIDSFINKAYSLENLEKSILMDIKDMNRKFMTVTDERDNLIGFIHVKEESEGIFELLRIYLLPDYKRLGLGTRLIDEMLNINQIKILNAWVEELNRPTRKFYEAKGFIQVADEIDVTDGYSTTLLCYEKKY